MKIEFPCPKSITSMIIVDGGYHCNYCDSKVYDLTDLSDDQLASWKSENGSKCIIINDTKQSESRNSFSLFAMALLLVGGSSLFNFADAQMESDLKKIDPTLITPQDSSLGILRVHLVNQHQDSIWGKVWVKLPNGKELELLESDQGKFYIEIPTYCKGKELVVYAEHLNKKKHLTVAMCKLGEELEITFSFKSKFRKKDVMMGYF